MKNKVTLKPILLKSKVSLTGCVMRREKVLLLLQVSDVAALVPSSTCRKGKLVCSTATDDAD